MTTSLVGFRARNSENCSSWASDHTEILNNQVSVSAALPSIRREWTNHWTVFSVQSNIFALQCVLGAVSHKKEAQGMVLTLKGLILQFGGVMHSFRK